MVIPFAEDKFRLGYTREYFRNIKSALKAVVEMSDEDERRFKELEEQLPKRKENTRPRAGMSGKLVVESEESQPGFWAQIRSFFG